MFLHNQKQKIKVVLIEAEGVSLSIVNAQRLITNTIWLGISKNPRWHHFGPFPLKKEDNIFRILLNLFASIKKIVIQNNHR